MTSVKGLIQRTLRQSDRDVGGRSFFGGMSSEMALRWTRLCEHAPSGSNLNG